MTHEARVYRRIRSAMLAAAEAGTVFNINSLDLLDPHGCNDDVAFDRRRDVDERGLVERDAYSEEHPRQSQGGREY